MVFLAQAHIRTVCTRVQLTGPVYLRSSDNLLPDLVVALRGPDAQPIEVELAGRTDSKHGGIRNSRHFRAVGDHDGTLGCYAWEGPNWRPT
jgi:hypothetical protein